MSSLETVYSPGIERPSLLSRLLPWRDAVTLFIVFAVSFCVVNSIDSANWVEGLPPLYPMAVFGLALGYAMARLPWRAILLYPLALLLGSTGLLIQVLAVTPDDGLKERCGEMVLRMRLWFDALTSGGISNDAFPVIVLLLASTWLMTYFLAWSVFRWNNPWIGLVPGGLALLINISYLPGRSSPSFVVFVIVAVLLIARVHFDGRTREWRDAGTSYPGSLHFFSMNQTLWAALAIVGAAWVIPLAGTAGPFPSVWRSATDPIADRFVGLSRVFNAVEGKKGLPLDRYASFLPYRGYFDAVEGPVMTVKTSQPGLLRAGVYDTYTPSGWKIGKRDREQFETDTAALSAALDAAAAQLRQPLVIEVAVQQPLPVFVVPGEPLLVDKKAKVETAGDTSNVTSLLPAKRLREGDIYTAVGLVSGASRSDLISAGVDYPSWATDRYLQLPAELPPAVANLARQLTQRSDTPYDKAAIIEDYLRSYPMDIDEEAPPSNSDAVAYFLFDRGSGHPLYHASAMVVMLRALGIPSRLAVGFAIPPNVENTEGIYSVSGSNAYAWPEVYFPSFGWVPFSPSRAYDPEGAAASSDDTWAGDPAGTMSAQDLLDMFPNAVPGATTSPDAPATTSAGENAAGGAALPWLMVPLLVVVGVSLASAAGFRFAWNRGLAGLSRPAEVLEKTRRLASWAGAGPHPSQTPREFLRSLQATLPDEPDLPVLSDAYERAEYGRQPLRAEDEAKLDALWRRLRPRLLKHMLRRRGRAGG